MKLIRFAAILLLIVVMCGTFALADVVVTTNVNMRSGPGTGYRVICTVPEGSHLDYMDEKVGGNGKVTWYQVKYDGQKGWIYAEYAEYDGVASVVASAYDLSNIENYTDVRVYFGKDVAASAQEIGLVGYQETLHDGVQKYFDDHLTFSGVENVDLIALFGGEYTVFGVAPGMEISEAAMMIYEKGLELNVVDDNCMGFIHRDSASGQASNLTLNVEDGTVISIEWSI